MGGGGGGPPPGPRGGVDTPISGELKDIGGGSGAVVINL